MQDVSVICSKCHLASFSLAVTTTPAKNNILLAIADELIACQEEIISANALDLANAKNLSIAMQDRLMLNVARIKAMAEGVRQVAQLKDPIGDLVDRWTRPNGLVISKVRAPLGVIGVIFEARPNVTIDVASLCIKSGNCVVLRGGKEAINSNRQLYKVIVGAISKVGGDPNIVGFIDDTSRESSLQLLKQQKFVNVIIPRGGDGLKKFVLDNATMPVIASAGGNCHIYVEQTADINQAIDIVYNAKMSRPSTCNACEQLLVDQQIASKFLPKLVDKLIANNCVINGCENSTKIDSRIMLADQQEYYKEHLDYVLTVYIVNDCDEAINRINSHNTQHSEAICSNDQSVIDLFTSKVDAGCVYVNASTRFTDGFEFGFGAEIGISTQKLHARGPLGLEQLTSEKYIINGQGQVRK